ncbi:MAG TPA: arylamine N-acetyltransferase [Isosphaeraceae bacterium]|nr:arylamine N-acetyltransferase [Isosphaeraceae bacterium]
MASPVEGPPREPVVDLEAYLARTGYTGRLDPSLATLQGLHVAHATSIPFENLDILLGREISLELDALESKLVASRRGGYCFEHNTLFSAVLDSLGFEVTRLAARVRFGSTAIRPRSHMLLSVKLDGQPWLVDVGFGGEGLLYPIRMLDPEESRQFGWTFRVQRDGDIQVLQSLHGEGWFDLYAFTQEPQYPIDFVVANHFTATHPHSPFVQSLVVQRQNCETRFTLRNRELSEESPHRRNTRTLPDDDAVLAILAEVFGLTFPTGTRFPYRDQAGNA